MSKSVELTYVDQASAVTQLPRMATTLTYR